MDAVNFKSDDDHEFTALHIAVRSGNLHSVLALLQHSHLSLNEQDAEGWTPLHYACYYGHAAIVLALQKADFCARNMEGNYPLHLAASMHHAKVFTVLQSDEAFMQRCQTNRAFKSLQDAQGNTLLNVAIDVREAEIVDWCLEVNMSLTKGNKNGMNSLHVAAIRGCVEIGRKLIGKVAGQMSTGSAFVDSVNNFQATPLYLASKHNQGRMVTFLLEQ